jgi:hypothetical protein
MYIQNRLIEIIIKLESAVNYEDWTAVNTCIDELNFIHEEMESSYADEDYEDY